MNVIEKIFALRMTPPFSRLYDSEIAQIAISTRVKELSAGELLAPGDEPLRDLVITVEGELGLGEASAPRVLGEESLLLGTPLGKDVVAGPGGTTCLLLPKGHFLTIFRECPWILVDLMEGTDANAGEGDDPGGGSP